MPPEGGCIREDLLRAFLERDKNAGLLATLRCVDECLQCEDGLTGARTAHHHARPVPRQSAAAEIVKPLDARRRFG